MKRIEIEVLGGEAALKAFAKTWRQARTGRQVETGLLEKDAHGRLITPFDEIVIRAGLRTAA